MSFKTKTLYGKVIKLLLKQMLFKFKFWIWLSKEDFFSMSVKLSNSLEPKKKE